MTNNGQPAETEETRDLLLRAQAGDSRAFDELFAQHRAALHSVIVRRLGKSLRGRIDPSESVVGTTGRSPGSRPMHEKTRTCFASALKPNYCKAWIKRQPSNMAF
jgi:hypothetical protein